jgi:hypothetical protein
MALKCAMNHLRVASDQRACCSGAVPRTTKSHAAIVLQRRAWADGDSNASCTVRNGSRLRCAT